MHARFGPAPARNGDWLLVRMPVLGAYAQMLGRLEAEESQRRISEQLATAGRRMSDQDRRDYLDGLRSAIEGAPAARRAAQRITLGLASRAGIRLAPPPADTGEEATRGG